VQRYQRRIGSNGDVSTNMRCYFHSAAVKVMALLTLPTAWTSVRPRLAAAVLCSSAGWKPMVGETAPANGSAASGYSCSGFSSAVKNR